jgi:peptidoglycan/LPS O-acetylase OafA/YrhL
VVIDRHWSALDGLRGVAVLVVLLYHFGAPAGTGGYLGVDTFFVISGFVVTLALRRSDAKGRRRTEFFLRRAARLLPNLCAFLLVVFVWDVTREHRLFTAQNAAVLEGLTQTYNVIESDGIATRHLWSLSMEWQFYAFLPLVLPFLAAAGIAVGVRRAALIALASFALRFVLVYAGHATFGHAYVWPITRLDGLMLGVGAALLFECGMQLKSRPLQLGATVGLTGAMLFAPRWWEAPQSSLFVVMPLVSICAAIVVCAVASGTTFAWLDRFLASSPMRYIGDRSYSIYLWHYFVGVALLAHGEGFAGRRMFFAQLAASLAVAIVMYELIEHPARVYLNNLIAEHYAGPPGEVPRPPIFRSPV